MTGKDILGVNAPLLSLADLWLAVTLNAAWLSLLMMQSFPPKAFVATLM